MYDLIVIGGGPGGYAASIRAAQLGAKVALVEEADMGGTCVNRGCIPSKIWLKAVSVKGLIEKADNFGLSATFNGFDLKAIKARKNGVAGDIKMGMEGLLSNNGIEVISGKAQVVEPGKVKVADDVIETKKIILATGSSPYLPDIPGLEDALLTTSEVFDLDTIPESVLVVGDGPVPVEMASLLHGLGASVSLAISTKRPLPDEDSDTGQRVAQVIREEGIEILSGATLSKVEKSGEGFKSVFNEGGLEPVIASRILYYERRANSEGLAHDSLNLGTDNKGAVTVDDSLLTSIKGVYAVGDLIGGRMLSHAASAMGVLAAENAVNDEAEAFNHNLVPRGLFSAPEYGAVGLSEDEAEDAGFEVETGDFPYSINGLAMAYGSLDGAVKIVTDSEYGEILGVHIVGANAVELIGEAVLAMKMEATAEDLANAIRVHPTFSEALMEAARDASGSALYLPKR